MTPRTLTMALATAGLLAGCQTVSEVASKAVGNEMRANLTGANEVQPGDPDGSGEAQVAFNDTTNQICTNLKVRNLSQVTAAHIHRGRAGENGPPIISLDPPTDSDSDDCTGVSDALLDEIRRDPAGFYVNVHTPEFPNGAIRGQLMWEPS